MCTTDTGKLRVGVNVSTRVHMHATAHAIVSNLNL